MTMLPCPTCKTTEYVRTSPYADRLYVVVCDGCYDGQPDDRHGTGRDRNEAIANWNEACADA